MEEISENIQTIPDGYKKSKVGIIPEDWECIKLGELINYKKGFAFKSETFTQKGVRVIRISDTTENSVLKDSPVFISDEEAKNLSSWELKENDLIISSVGSRPPLYESMVGKVVLVPNHAEGSLLNQNAIRVRSNKKIIQYILYNYLNTKRYIYHIESIVRGNANQVSITLKDLFLFNLPIPPIKEQEKIAKILSTQDKIIELKEKLLVEKEKQKKFLMQVLLNTESEHFIRLDGFEGEWILKNLSEVSDIIMGQSPDSKFYSNVESGLPLIQGNADCDDRKTMKRIFTKQITKTCNCGDIIMSVRAPVGKISIASYDSCIGRGVCAISSNNYHNFLYFYLMSIENKWRRISQGSTFESIASKDIYRIKLKLPSDYSEANRIVGMLNCIDAAIMSLKKGLDIEYTNKKALMQQLLTGKVRVKV